MRRWIACAPARSWPARYTTNMPRAPEGEYVTAQYRATYGEKDAVETVSLKKDDGTWRVAGYYVKPGGQ